MSLEVAEVNYSKFTVDVTGIMNILHRNLKRQVPFRLLAAIATATAAATTIEQGFKTVKDKVWSLTERKKKKCLTSRWKDFSNPIR